MAWRHDVRRRAKIACSRGRAVDCHQTHGDRVSLGSFPGAFVMLVPLGIGFLDSRLMAASPARLDFHSMVVRKGTFGMA